MIVPLAIIQARMGSTRLPGKMLLPLQGEPLVIRVWRTTCLAVGAESTVVAIPATAENEPLRDVLVAHKAQVFRYEGPEWDVLSRFHACAHRYRWHPDTVILRVTPDDPWKSHVWMRRVIAGERVPVELGGEAFTLAMLDAAQQREPYHIAPNASREHITWALFGRHAPPAPPASDIPWTIDTHEDYDAVVAALADPWPRKHWDQEGEL